MEMPALGMDHLIATIFVISLGNKNIKLAETNSQRVLINRVVGFWKFRRPSIPRRGVMFPTLTHYMSAKLTTDSPATPLIALNES